MKRRELLAWIFSGRKIAAAPREFARAWAEAIKRFDLKGRAGEACLVLETPAPTLLLGVGATDPNQSADAARAIHEAAVRAVESARRHKFDRVILGGVPRELQAAALRGLAAGGYAFKISKEKRPARIAAEVLGAPPRARQAAEIVAESVVWARDLVNRPAADKAPASLAARIAADLHSTRGIKAAVWNEKKLAREHCRGILAVGAGSVNGPRLVRLDYAPAGARRRLVLVGKGVTFDSGGLCLKPAEGMKGMKGDMAGAAAVVAALRAIARLRLKLRVTALAGLVENMPGGSAFKVGDVIAMRSGKTVEVVNTDAEGRLVLADLLDLAAELKPDAMVDLATLTGACLVALGEETAGCYSLDERLAETLTAAAAAAGEPLWRLPLGRDFREKLKGEISDLKNVGNRNGGANTAAQFLAEFVGQRPWAHLDIAGPAFRDAGSAGRPVGATGFGVATLVELARTMAGA